METTNSNSIQNTEKTTTYCTKTCGQACIVAKSEHSRCNIPFLKYDLRYPLTKYPANGLTSIHSFKSLMFVSKLVQVDNCIILLP